MNKIYFLLLLLMSLNGVSQSWNPAPYCTPITGTYAIPCSQPGPSNTQGNWINDFINGVVTSGAVVNINNPNSGCNGLPNNYIFYCNHPLQVNAGQTVTCSVQSASVWPGGFAVFIDWNNDNIFQVPSERVANTASNPPAGGWANLTFTVPASQSNGVYRMRIREVWAAVGSSIPPCTAQAYGEIEDYNVYVGITPSAATPITATASPNQTVCAGQNINLSVSFSGTSSTTFDWGGPNSFSSTVQNPTVVNTSTASNGFYYVSLSSATCPVMAITHVYIQQGPNVNISSTNSVICSGATVTLTASGSNNYTWSPSSSTNTTIIVTPSITTVYTVATTGTTSICAGSKTFTLTVNQCTGINEWNEYNGQGFIYPNPFHDLLNVKTKEPLNIKILNSIGELIMEKRILRDESIDMNMLSKGVYYMLIGTGSDTSPIKLIKD